MIHSTPSLGAMLRHLIDLLDRDVQRAYDDAAFDYRPRYTPIVRSLEAIGPASIRALASHAGMTHSAVSQTVAQMARDGLARQEPGADGRERIVSATPALKAMLPQLHLIWASTNSAADRLDAELSAPLSRIVGEAIDALEARPFGERIREARESVR